MDLAYEQMPRNPYYPIESETDETLQIGSELVLYLRMSVLNLARPELVCTEDGVQYL